MDDNSNQNNKNKVEISYDTLWKAIIRPPRDEYDDDQ